MNQPYIGRFAPSPTGPLHLGSLYTAVASYLDAKAHNGTWLLRIEDLDPPREQADASEMIIHSLKVHGLHWDKDILWQSQCHQAYQAAIETLMATNKSFYCECTRQQLKEYKNRYPGFCHNKHLTELNTPTNNTNRYAIRLKAPQPTPSFKDRLFGPQVYTDLKTEPELFNDFIIKRKDGLFAYQLAVVIDDIDQNVNQIVRGNDILDSTFKQLYLYEYLQQKPPEYLHLPVITNNLGQKLSKQHHALAINDNNACENLLQVLSLLQQDPPPTDAQSCVEDILYWATKHWDIEKIPHCTSIQMPI